MRTTFIIFFACIVLSTKGQNTNYSKYLQYFIDAQYAIQLNVGIGPLYAAGTPNQGVVYSNVVFYCNNFNMSGSFFTTAIDRSEVLFLTNSIGYQIHIAEIFTVNPRVGWTGISTSGKEANSPELSNSGLNMGITLAREFFKNPKHKLVLSLAFDYHNINFNNHPVFTDNNMYQLSGLIGYKFYFGKVD